MSPNIDIPSSIIDSSIHGPIYSAMRPTLFRVLDSVEEVPGCMTIRVEPDGDGGDTDFMPGQFYMIYVFGQGEVPVSVSGDPTKLNELTFTVMAVGSVTAALCAVQPGEAVYSTPQEVSQ